jgi:ATP phosphoribosyltransferase
MALPKGRILGEVLPLLARAGIEPEPEFADEDSRQLRFATNHPALDLIRVRNFDVATFVAFGAAQLGVAGNDVLMEFDYPEIYAPLDLKIGTCRLSVAARQDLATEDGSRLSHVRVATKYPELTRRHFAQHGIQAEVIKLNGAMELAPVLGLCPRIVDRRDARRERARRAREHRRCHLSSYRQPAGAEDAPRRGRCLDRSPARGRRCPLGSRPPRLISSPVSRRSSR